MKWTVAYYRNSQDKYQKNSLNTQINNAKHYSIEHSLPIDKVYSEPNTSAAKNDSNERPRMKELLEDIKAGKVENLLVYKRDRLARQSSDYMVIYHILKQHNVKVHFTSENELPMKYTNLGEFLELILSGMVEHEVTQMKKRIAETNFSKFEEGKILGRLSDYGYKSKKKKKSKEKNSEDEEEIITIEPEPFELNAVFDFYNMVINGSFSTLNEMVKSINKEKKYLRRNGGLWEKSTLQDLLTNTIFYGERFMHFSILDKTAHRLTPETKLISKDKWDKAQDLIKVMGATRSIKDKKTFNYLLEGLVTCTKCGEILEGKAGEHKKQKVGKYVCGCSRRGILKEAIERPVQRRAQLFINSVFHKGFKELAHLYKVEQNKGIKEQIKLIENEIHLGKEVLLKKTQKWLNDKESKKLKSELSIQKAKLDALEQKLENLHNKINQNELFFKELVDRKEWLVHHSLLRETEDEGMKKQLLQSLINKITLNGDKLDFEFKHPLATYKEVIHE